MGDVPAIRRVDEPPRGRPRPRAHRIEVEAHRKRDLEIRHVGSRVGCHRVAASSRYGLGPHRQWSGTRGASRPGRATSASSFGARRGRRNGGGMGRIVVWMQQSLDGYVDASDGAFDWPVVHAELHQYFVDCNEKASFLYGRRVFEMMAAHWPTADEGDVTAEAASYARLWRPKPKVVFPRRCPRRRGTRRSSRRSPPRPSRGSPRRPRGTSSSSAVPPSSASSSGWTSSTRWTRSSTRPPRRWGAPVPRPRREAPHAAARVERLRARRRPPALRARVARGETDSERPHSRSDCCPQSPDAAHRIRSPNRRRATWQRHAPQARTGRDRCSRGAGP